MPASATQQEPGVLDRTRTAVKALLRRQHRHELNEVDESIKSESIKVLDCDAWAYNEWKGIESQAKSEAEALKPGIQAAIGRFGFVPEGAPKSLRVDTPSFICTNTTGISMEIDDEAVLNLDIALSTSKKLRDLFDQLFVRRIEYTLAPTAQQFMTHGKLPEAQEQMIRELYSRCFLASTKSPSLTVESKDELKAKQQAAAVAKAAKKSSGKGRA